MQLYEPGSLHFSSEDIPTDVFAAVTSRDDGIGIPCCSIDQSSMCSIKKILETSPHTDWLITVTNHNHNGSPVYTLPAVS